MTMIMTRIVRCGVLTVVTAAMLTACGSNAGSQGNGGSAASAEDYPDSTVTLLVPYAAGGTTDRISRIVAAALEDEMGETFVVTNVPGAGGSLAINDLLNGPTDGSQLAVIATPSALIPPVLGQADYGPDDFAPVGVIAEQPIALVVGADSPFGSAREFIEAAKANPETVTIGTNGPTTSTGIAVNRLRDEYGLPIQQVPFGGQSELTSNLLGGNLDSIIVNTGPDVLDRIEGGEFVPIAVFSPERLSYLPDVPTLAELGFEEVTNATSRFGLVGPEAMPDEIRDALEDALQTILSDEETVSNIGENEVLDEFVSGEAWQEDMRRVTEVYEEILSN